MKGKLLVLFLAGIMLTGLLTGCGEDATEENTSTYDESQNTNEDTTTTEEQNTGQEENEDAAQLSEMVFDKMDDIDSDRLCVQYGDVLLEIGVTTPDDIESMASESKMGLSTTFTDRNETTKIASVTTKADKEVLNLFFIDFEANNEFGFEEGYHLTSIYIAPNFGNNTRKYYVSSDYIFYTEAFKEFANENAFKMGVYFDNSYSNFDFQDYFR